MASTWQFAGRASAVPNAGDMLPAMVGATPIFLVRQKSGEIAGFYNVCPHRGAKVLPQARCGAKVLACPYHAWSFNLDGSLRRRPHYHGADKHDVTKPGDEMERPGLFGVRTEIFFDWVFVNLDGTAQPLADQFQPLVDRLQGYDFSGAVFDDEVTFDVQANWKLAHENYFDILHKIAIHPELQHSAPIRTNVAYEWVTDDLAVTHHKVQNPFDGRGKGLPGLPGFPEDMRQLGIAVHVYPNTNIMFWDGQITLFTCSPMGPDRTIETFSIYFAEAAMTEDCKSHRQAVFDTWIELNNQDIQPLLWMQEARHIPVFDGGSFSPYWDDVIARYVEKLKADTA